MTQIVSLDAFRSLKKVNDEELAYHAKVLDMSKIELLNEMVRFQEERSERGELTPKMMVRGRMLFRELEKAATTQELQILTRSYRRHLDHEYDNYVNQNKKSEIQS